jgi:hypothetical protein
VIDETGAVVEALLEASIPTVEVLQPTNTQQTAKKAIKILEGKGLGFVVPTSKQKKILLIEFAKRNLVIYGKAFDIIKITSRINLNDEKDVATNLDNITLYEIKSTNKSLDPDFNKIFFRTNYRRTSGRTESQVKIQVHSGKHYYPKLYRANSV